MPDRHTFEKHRDTVPVASRYTTHEDAFENILIAIPVQNGVRGRCGTPKALPVNMSATK